VLLSGANNGPEEPSELVTSKLTPDEQPVRRVTGDYFSPLADVSDWSQTASGIRARIDPCTLSVDILNDDLFRLKIVADWQKNSPPTYAVVRTPESWHSAFTVTDTGASLELRTAKLLIVVSKSLFKIEAFREDGTPISECPAGNNLGTFARLNDEFIVTRKRAKTDVILGLGQKTGALNRAGRSFVLWNTDVLNPRTLKEFAVGLSPEDPRADPRSDQFDPYYISIPFYQALDSKGRSAGFFIDNLHRAEYDFSQPGETRIKFVGGVYEEYVFAGPTLERILESYTGLTGRMSAPPLWAIGYHHCRWFPYADRDVLDVAGKYRKAGIPCDSFWLDIDHMEGYRVFTWNKKLFPDPKKTLSALDRMGFRAVTIVDPGVKVEDGNPNFESGKKDEVFCVTEQGSIYQGQVWPGRTAFPDFASSPGREWWGELNAKHIQFGLSGIWNDMNEPATGDIPPDPMRFDGGRYSHSAYHNGYALMMAMSTYDGLRRAMPDIRTFILSRAGSAGIQRYAANWLGDNMSRWDHLRMSLPMSLGLGLSGQAFVGADIGGFGENCEPELLARWYQAACLAPFCRNHNDAGGIDQYPWSFGPEVLACCKAALELRYRLLPYLYNAFIQATETGLPILRPMVMEDPRLAEVQDQFLVGDHLLAAPVVVKGAVSRHVKLPPGEWFDWWSGHAHHTASLTVKAPLDSFPLFVRTGAVIPLWPSAPPSTAGYQPKNLDLHVFVPMEDGEFRSRVVEDDGATYAFERGERLVTEFVLSRKGKQVKLTATTSGRPHKGFARTCWSIHLKGHAPELTQVIKSGVEGFECEFELE
jgi:alpha-glucosidase